MPLFGVYISDIYCIILQFTNLRKALLKILQYHSMRIFLKDRCDHKNPTTRSFLKIENMGGGSYSYVSILHWVRLGIATEEVFYNAC